MMEQSAEKSNNVIVSPRLLKWNPSEYVFNPDFDLGLGDEWTVRFPLSSDNVNQIQVYYQVHQVLHHPFLE